MGRGGRGLPSGIVERSAGCAVPDRPWQTFVLRPLPQGHGSLRPADARAVARVASSWTMSGSTSDACRPVLTSRAMIRAGLSMWRKNAM